MTVADYSDDRIGRDDDFQIIRKDEMNILLVADASTLEGL